LACWSTPYVCDISEGIARLLTGAEHPKAA
jgi:hypothetical protein